VWAISTPVVDVKVRKIPWGCLVSAFVCLATENIAQHTNVIVLLGSIDKNKSNDWMAPDNSPIAQPANWRDHKREPAYQNCTKNWCVRNHVISLFAYELGLSHKTYFNYDAPYSADVEIDTTSKEIVDICGTDMQCLLEGQVGGIELAQDLFDAKKQFEDVLADNSCKDSMRQRSLR
jgi:hypothetical protein